MTYDHGSAFQLEAHIAIPQPDAGLIVPANTFADFDRAPGPVKWPLKVRTCCTDQEHRLDAIYTPK